MSSNVSNSSWTGVNYVTSLNKIRLTSFKLFTQTSWIYKAIFLLFDSLLCIVILLSSSSLGKKRWFASQISPNPHNKTSTIIITSIKQLRLQNLSQELYSINNIEDKINECWLVNEEECIFPFIISWLSLLMMKWYFQPYNIQWSHKPTSFHQKPNTANTAPGSSQMQSCLLSVRIPQVRWYSPVIECPA